MLFDCLYCYGNNIFSHFVGVEVMFLDISCVTITENNPVDAEIHEIIPSESVRYIGEYENKYEGNLPTN